MRAIDADELIETCQSQLNKIDEWQKESGLNYDAIRKGYSMMIDMLRSAETLNEEVPIVHVGYDEAQMGREK